MVMPGIIWKQYTCDNICVDHKLPQFFFGKTDINQRNKFVKSTTHFISKLSLASLSAEIMTIGLYINEEMAAEMFPKITSTNVFIHN